MTRLFTILVLAFLSNASIWAQRIQQPLGRGVVVVGGGSNMMISWRRLAQEPENATYNIYTRKAGGEYTKLNASPLRNTNYSVASNAIASGTDVAVTVITDGVESDLSVPFHYVTRDARSMFMDILFPDYPLSISDYTTSFVWPADLDGDGEMDFIVDRKSKVSISTRNHKIQGYLRDGTLLWTVDMGPNVAIDQGQDDMVLAYDIDCDGRAEVIIKSSDGTRFWDAANNTWGKYVFGKNTGDTDGDGIINYATQTVKNPPFYVTVVDGMTGAEKVTAELDYSQVRDGVDTYSRNNRQNYKADNDWLEYASLCGQFAICYFDGVHPSLGIEVKDRTTDGNHHYYLFSFTYDWSDGTPRNWHHDSTFSAYGRNPSAAQFHMVRVCDVDGDGIDELIPGGYGWSPKAGMVMSANISHGDRFRLSDIDPERPGLECFAIQQYAGDMLGQILYQAEDGKAIKKWYLNAVGDVGRGECMDIDPDHLGWEMWSTMAGVYDAKGDLIPELDSHYPCEGIWWDGDLGRENVGTSDSHYNVYVEDFKTGRLIQIARDSGWRYITVYAKRAAFWGDMIGDWREELILLHMEGGEVAGVCGFSTDYTTTENRIYCLQEDPHYRGDCTTRGYYQSPNPGFYLGYDMPRPQLPPVMVTDLVQRTSDTYTNYMRTKTEDYADGKSLLMDLNTAKNIELAQTIKPSTLYLMPVKGQVINVGGTGAFGGNGDIWKSQQGTVSLNVPVTTAGTLYISEGTIESSSTISSPVQLRARGTLAGSATVEDTIIFEGALNYEGCRLMPHGVMTLKKTLNANKRVYVELSEPSDYLHTDGNLRLTGSVIFTVNYANPEAGKYKLIEYTGQFTGDVSRFSVRGLVGLSYNITNEDGAIWLIINSQREPNDDVAWTGMTNNLWDYQTTNFAISTTNTEFVAGDKVEFNDDAEITTITMDALMPTSGVTFKNDTKAYTFSGNGGFSGDGGLTFDGTGRVTLNTTKSDYTGATVMNSGTVVVSDLADGGIASPLGAATATAGKWKMGKATLVVNNSNAATNRPLQLTDTATIQVASGTTALKGQISGRGTLVKTGNGQLNITYAGANTYSGGTILKGGTLAMGAWNTTFGTATSRIRVSANSTITIFNNNSTSAIPSLQNQIEIEEGRTLTINGGQRCRVVPTLTGKGTLKINFPYVRGDFGPSATNFEGVIEVTSGELRLASAINMPKGTLRLTGNGYVYNNNGAHTLGALEGTNADALVNVGTWNIGYLNTDFSFAGKLASGITVNKYGTGRMTLTGASGAPINIYAGEVEVANTSASTTTGTITVRSGATLLGAGQTGPVVVNAGGMIATTKSTILTGAITLTGTLRVNSGGKIRVRGRGTSSSRIDTYNVAGSITLSSPSFVMERLNGEWQPDEQLKVFTGAGAITLTGTPTFTPERPLDGYKWDWSELQSSGVIRIVADPDAVGINHVNAFSNGGQEVYDLTGRRMDNPSKGVYILNGKKVIVK